MRDYTDCYVELIFQQLHIDDVSTLNRKWFEVEERLHYFSKTTGRSVPTFLECVAKLKERKVNKKYYSYEIN